jgi:anti-sigma regulatory factor (Ser/Thr protein kinase)
MTSRERSKKKRGGEVAPATRLQEHMEVRFPSRTEYLAPVRRVAGWFAERAGFAERERSRVELAVAEATTNIIRHAYGGDPGREIHLRLAMTDEGIEVQFTDQGRSVPEAALAGRGPGQLEPGGLGLHMMKTCMDDLSYEPLPGGGARLTMRKHREEREP